jgi:hypothetical protein
LTSGARRVTLRYTQGAKALGRTLAEEEVKMATPRKAPRRAEEHVEMRALIRLDLSRCSYEVREDQGPGPELWIEVPATKELPFALLQDLGETYTDTDREAQILVEER